MIRRFVNFAAAFENAGIRNLRSGGWTCCTRLDRKVTPDLVLTELNLYGIDGLPFIHHIQKLEMEQPPKIVVLTEQRVEQTISQCFSSG